MNRKKIIILIIALILIIVLCFIFLKLNNKNNNFIPENYIAVFNGGSGEQTYSTYIYKIENGQKNYGFKYINTTNITIFWGSSKRKINITDKGEVMYVDEVFNVAKKNNAYSYVRLPNDNKIYMIEEYMKMF